MRPDTFSTSASTSSPSRRGVLTLFIGALALVMTVAGTLPAAARSQPATDPAPIRIVVTIPPLLWPVRELLGTGPKSIEARVTLILRPGLSEHGFELTPSQMEDIRRADVVVMAGHGLEPRVASLAAKPGPDGTKPMLVSFEGLIAALHASGDHSACAHGHEHEDNDQAAHDHATPAADPHMWLDPILMRGFVTRVEGALGAILERRLTDAAQRERAAQALRQRADAARRACDDLHAEHQRALEPLKGRAIVTHHNAWAYLCARYNLEVAAVVRPIETVEPTPGDVMLAVKAIREQNARAVFVEPQFPGGVAQRIAKTARVKLETLDPLGAGDWPATMRANLAALVRGLTDDAPDR